MSDEFTYISLSNGSETWNISTNVDRMNGMRACMLCNGSEGVIDPGENSLEPIERSSSNGSVSAEYVRLKGKDITLNVLIWQADPMVDIRQIHLDFINFVTSGNLIYHDDYAGRLRTYHCQYQRLTTDKKHFGKGKNFILLKLYLHSNEGI